MKLFILVEKKKRIKSVFSIWQRCKLNSWFMFCKCTSEIQEHHQRKDYPRHELHETIVRYSFGEIGLHVNLDIIHLVMLEAVKCAWVIVHHDDHRLTLGEPSLAVSCTFPEGAGEGRQRFLRGSSLRFFDKSSIKQTISATLSVVIMGLIIVWFFISNW